MPATGRFTVAKRYNSTSPCPVCGTGSKGCSVTDDELQSCRGEPTDPTTWKLLKSGDVFNCYRRLEDRWRRDSGHTNGKSTSSKPAKDWPAEAAKFAANLTDAARGELARELGLPLAALEAFPLLGWHTEEECWTFPEHDAGGRIIGITRRGRDGAKRMMPGGHRGLYIPAGWQDRPGPVFVPEGASDVLSLALCGLAAIGRPSNTGGGDQLAEALRDLPTGRPIVMLGENDAKPDGKWPGKEGAEKVAEVLRSKLNRHVRIVFPPAEVKDARNWVQDLAAGFAEAEDWPSIGRAILDHSNREAAKGSRFTFIDSRDFLFADYRREFLIPRVLVKGEAGTIAGPSKGLKTSLAVDMAISLASGSSFLGEFPVSRRARVAIVSGESGAATLQETARRILKAKGVEAEDVFERLQWCFELPQFADVAQMLDFAERLKGLRAEVVFIDPVYLCIAGSVDHANLFEMGEAFRVVAEVLLKAGVTPILIHHANRQLKAGPPMELQHLAYSGLEQFARQFILINRQSAYEGDGKHPLWFSAGGSAGHGGLWDVRIEEGTTDDHFLGRFWDVKVLTLDKAKETKFDEREGVRREVYRKKSDHDKAEVLLAIDAELTMHDAATKTALRDRTGFNTVKLNETLIALTEAGLVEEIEFEKVIGNSAKRMTKGFRRMVVS